MREERIKGRNMKRKKEKETLFRGLPFLVHANTFLNNRAILLTCNWFIVLRALAPSEFSGFCCPLYLMTLNWCASYTRLVGPVNYKWGQLTSNCLFLKSTPVKSVFFSPIIILFLQYSRKRSSHVPEI
jgi:hypothetical protein